MESKNFLFIFLVLSACLFEETVSSQGYTYPGSPCSDPSTPSNSTILATTIIQCVQDQISNYSLNAYFAGASLAYGSPNYGNDYGQPSNYGSSNYGSSNYGNSYNLPVIFYISVSFPFGYGDPSNTTMFFNAVVTCINDAINSTGLDGFSSGVTQSYPNYGYSSGGYGGSYGNGGYSSNYGPLLFTFSAIFRNGIDQCPLPDASYGTNTPSYPGSIVPVYTAQPVNYPTTAPATYASPTYAQPSAPATYAQPAAPTYTTTTYSPPTPVPVQTYGSQTSNYPSTSSGSSNSYSTGSYSTSSSEAAGY